VVRWERRTWDNGNRFPAQASPPRQQPNHRAWIWRGC
jgi:hypothetical protein